METMKTIITLEWAFDILDLKEYLKECEYEKNKMELKDCIIDYFKEEFGVPFTKFENYNEILEKLVQIV